MKRSILTLFAILLLTGQALAVPVAAPGPGELLIKGNDEGMFTLYTPGGQPAALGEGKSKVNVGPDIQATVLYDPVMGFITIKNECESKAVLKISIMSTERTAEPCEEKTLFLSTAEENQNIPEIDENTLLIENPDEGREPISPTTA